MHKNVLPICFHLQTGFVKAFSSSPQAFTVGFSHVEHVMKTLFVRTMYLWPRFHATVSASLDKCKVRYTYYIIVHCPFLQIISIFFCISQVNVRCSHSCVFQVNRWMYTASPVKINSGTTKNDWSCNCFINIPVIIRVNNIYMANCPVISF